MIEIKKQRMKLKTNLRTKSEETTEKVDTLDPLAHKVVTINVGNRVNKSQVKKENKRVQN